MKTRVEWAEELFAQGYNCAQSVACAFADLLELPQAQVALMVSSFGGGIGRLRETCGAVSGMVFALGACRGYNDPTDSAAKSDHYAAVQRLVQMFVQENGSLCCRELLGNQGADHAPVSPPRDQAFYQARPCQKLVCSAVAILAQYLGEELYEAK